MQHIVFWSTVAFCFLRSPLAKHILRAVIDRFDHAVEIFLAEEIRGQFLVHDHHDRIVGQEDRIDGFERLLEDLRELQIRLINIEVAQYRRSIVDRVRTGHVTISVVVIL